MMPVEDSLQVILARLEGKLDAHAENLDRHIHDEGDWQIETTQDIQAIDGAIRGNGGGRPGLNVRIDRLEQREKGRARMTWLAIGAALAALSAWTRSLFER